MSRSYVAFQAVFVAIITSSATDVKGGTVATYQAERLRHQTGEYYGFEYVKGEPANGGWQGIKGKHKAGFLTFGPYVRLKAGRFYAQWRMRMTEWRHNRKPIVTIQVRDATTGSIVADRQVYWSSFNGSGYGAANLSFRTTRGHMYEFRTYWHGRATVKVDAIKLKR